MQSDGQTNPGLTATAPRSDTPAAFDLGCEPRVLPLPDRPLRMTTKPPSQSAKENAIPAELR